MVKSEGLKAVLEEEREKNGRLMARIQRLEQQVEREMSRLIK
jgi:hypothetical protein